MSNSFISSLKCYNSLQFWLTNHWVSKRQRKKNSPPQLNKKWPKTPNNFTIFSFDQLKPKGHKWLPQILSKNVASDNSLMLLYHVRLNQMDFFWFVCFVFLAELLLLGGKSKCLFHLAVPISLEVLRPKGAELLHLLLFFLAGRGLGDPTSPQPNCFHSKPDVSSPPLSLPHQTVLIDSVSRHSLTAAVKMIPKLCSNAAGSKCLSSFLSIFLSFCSQM